MSFSLILATLGQRPQEIERFLKSVAAQSAKDIQLIIVDQSETGICEKFEKEHLSLNIDYIRTNEKGLSKARNLGLKYVKNTFVGFPDDDCWYPNGLLSKVKKIFDQTNCEIVTTAIVDPDLNYAPITKFLQYAQFLNLKTVWHGGAAAGLFARANISKDLLFDESLGLGANSIYGSGEETDFLIRALKSSFKIFFDSELHVYHPHKQVTFDKTTKQRTMSYGAGLGRVLRKNKFPIFDIIKMFLRPLGGVFIYTCLLNFKKANLFYASLKGRIRGYFL